MAAKFAMLICLYLRTVKHNPRIMLKKNEDGITALPIIKLHRLYLMFKKKYNYYKNQRKTNENDRGNFFLLSNGGCFDQFHRITK